VWLVDRWRSDAFEENGFSQSTSAAELMTLVDGTGTHMKVTAFCMQAPVTAALSEALALGAKYLPE